MRLLCPRMSKSTVLQNPVEKFIQLVHGMICMHWTWRSKQNHFLRDILIWRWFASHPFSPRNRSTTYVRAAATATRNSLKGKTAQLYLTGTVCPNQFSRAANILLIYKLRERIERHSSTMHGNRVDLEWCIFIPCARTTCGLYTLIKSQLSIVDFYWFIHQ